MRTVGIAIAFCVSLPLLAQESPDIIRVQHNFYWRKSIDQKYQGAIYGYQSGVWKLKPGAEPGTSEVDAHYWVVSDSNRDLSAFEKPIDAERASTFALAADGSMSHFQGAGVPYYRNYPAGPPAGAGPGSVWIGTGELVSDFLRDGKTTRIPILIEYRWDKPGDYFGVPVIQVKAQYALRYKKGMDPEGDPSLDRAEGTHIATISYDATSFRPLFVSELVKEQFSTGGRVISIDGRIWTTFNGVPALKTAVVTDSLNQQLQAAKVSGVTVTPDKLGVKLTLENLRFVADKATLLTGEDQRLKAISELLRTVPDRSFLVIGHTAAVGTVESQVQLSWDRALAIVERLKAEGIEAKKLLYEGRGGTQPVASNDTEDGRAQNRRVEIIVLDQ
jgi:outer membrane protein OmpA-like peptidoglycan-associated protein